tara:strand:- start:135 stop:794 length:660 start_codon:yes stop_codon:yes gene_type:complete
MSEHNNSYIGLRKDLIIHITKGAHAVLDVGCALGVNGKYLLDNNIANKVVGIEFDKQMAQEASKNITKVFCGDLNNQEFRKTILNTNYTFDYILFGDILEHLYDPLKVLIELKSILNPNGQIIISLPNIGHVELLIQVFLKGTWPKNERGIFDKTHIRWFTRKDVFDLLKSADLKLLTYERKYRARDAIGSTFNWKTKILKFINKDLVTFQHVVVCRRG